MHNKGLSRDGGLLGAKSCSAFNSIAENISYYILKLKIVLLSIQLMQGK